MVETPSYNTLFVLLPNEETITVRKLSDCITLEYIKAKLELTTGIPGDTIQLSYGALPLDDNLDLNFGENIRNGGLVKLSISEDLLPLYLAVCTSNTQNILHSCIAGDISGTKLADSNQILSSEDLKLFCLQVASGQGNLDVVRALVNLDVDGLWWNQCTRYGRTLAHIAVASDQTRILDFLLEHDAPIQTEDCFHDKPIDVAVIHGACTCERAIRQFLLRRTRGKSPGKRLPKSTGKNSHLKVCWKEATDETTSETRLAGVPDRPIRLFNQLTHNTRVSGMSLASSRQSSARSTPATHSPPRMSKASSSSATNNSRQSVHASPNCSTQVTHKKCVSQPQFMAFRSVGQEELRPVAVEYVPLDTFTYRERHQRPQSKSTNMNRTHDYPRAPCSSLNNSTENLTRDIEPAAEKERLLQKRNELMRKYTNVKGGSSRAQSAKYYRTRYHIEAEFDGSVPKPRPATAGPRYREWKVWLLEKMELEAQKAQHSQLDNERKEQNDVAYAKWLAQHASRHQEDDVTDSDDDGGDDDNENEKAYETWKESKYLVFKSMDNKRKEAIRNGNDDDGKNSQTKSDRRLTVYELGSCSDAPVEAPKPDHYMRAFQTWKHTKKNYENWRKRKGLPLRQKTQSKDEFLKSRDTLLLQGMTYSEWLGLKEREESTNKLHIHRL